MTVLKKHQPSMTIDEQIINLREKGMIIENEDTTKTFLNKVSYFRLIKAYSLGYKSQNGNYYDDVCFENLVELYQFNSDLRHQIFMQIEKVEVSLRCRLSNHFCDKYGVLGYEDANNFINATRHTGLLADIKREAKRNEKTPFVKNFTNNYEGKNLPLYALVELLSFGTLSLLFKNLKNEDKKIIASIYGVGHIYLESWIESLSYVRNVCAHYGRLYNAKLSKTPRLYKQYHRDGISNYRIFATLLTLKHLLPCDHYWKDFTQVIELLIEKYPSVNLSLIGFPKNWIDYL